MTELEHYIASYLGIGKFDELVQIVSFFKLSTIKKGEYFLKTGKNCDKLSFIKSGFLRIFAASEKEEVTQWIAGKGYFVTDLSSFIFDNPARWTIQALADSELYTISSEDYKKVGTIVSKWHELEKQFIVRCFTLVEDRIFTHLSMTAEERYHYFFEHNKELFNQVPLQYIASMLGMSPETLSRMRRK
ncbi:Crp/Fnr family transcriptional regulator [Pedobacter sp. PAMC26386]|nr:Crp/Fnr family transcriptional regulator [Pedobacter sp. PAMC26386]